MYGVWKHLNLPDPTPVQYDIAKHLQNAPKRGIITAFRGVGKSWITSAYVLWLLYRNKELKIMVVSASKDRADAFSQFTKRLINDIPWLEHLKPQKGQRDSLISFDVGGCKPDHSPSVRSLGITSQLTGSRADVIVADDVEVVNNSATQQGRDKLASLVQEFDAILKPLETSKIIYLGTPQTEMSLYNTLTERGYEMKIWCAQYPTEAQKASYGDRLAPFIRERQEALQAHSGTSTDPMRFSDADLLERKLSYGKAGFALQFMLDTSLSDADKYPLKLSDLIVHEIHPENAPETIYLAKDRKHRLNDMPSLGLAGDYYYRPYAVSEQMLPYQGRVMAIDPSGRGADETTYAIGYMLNGIIYCPEVGGLGGGYDENVMRTLAAKAKEHKVNQIIVEENFGDGMFTQLLKPWLNIIYPCNVEEVKHHTQKERRIIDTLEPVMMQHRLVFAPRVIENDYAMVKGENPDTKHVPLEKSQQYSLFHQMTRITYERGALAHDDRLDALAMMVSYWIDWMEINQHKQEQDRKLEEFINYEHAIFNALNITVPNERGGSWLDY
ncbi:hypothetical protein GCM10026988_04330 [Vibrio panuliri]